MIHVINCPRTVFEKCNDSGCCKSLCSVPLGCCETCTAGLSGLWERPFGGLVIGTWWICGIEILAVTYSLANPAHLKEMQLCDFSGNMTYAVTGQGIMEGADNLPHEGLLQGHLGIPLFLAVQGFFALLAFVFAAYLQSSVWQKLKSNSDSNDLLAEITTTAEQVRKTSFEVLLYDFGVLFYFFTFIVASIWSWLGAAWTKADTPGPGHCDPGNWPHWAAVLGRLYTWFCILYFLCWYVNYKCMTGGGDLVLGGLGKAAAAAGGAGAAVAAATRYERVGADERATPSTATPPPAATGGKADPRAAAADAATQEAARRTGIPATQWFKLLACLSLDLLGDATYIIPALGEAGDAVWAPMQAMALKSMFHGNFIAFLGLAEEIAPGTDAIPTATIAWVLETFFPHSLLARILGITPPEWAGPPPR